MKVCNPATMVAVVQVTGAEPPLCDNICDHHGETVSHYVDLGHAALETMSHYVDLGLQGFMFVVLRPCHTMWTWVSIIIF